MKKLLPFICFAILSNVCFPQSQFSKENYKNFVGQWSRVEDSIQVHQYGFSPSDFNISLKENKFEISVFATQFYIGDLKGNETLLIGEGNGSLTGDILVFVSPNILIWITTGSKWEYKVGKYYRVKKYTPEEVQKKQTSGTTDYNKKFCGIWKLGTEASYLRILKDEKGRLKFNEGYENEGKKVWTEPMLEDGDGIYLKLLNGKLVGQFVSYNFGATHGVPFNYKLTLE